MMSDPRSILITGASSGIGAALALHYAARGVTLSLSGRDAARVEAVAEQCRAQGAIVYSVVLDVRDRMAMRRWIDESDRIQPLDLVIANAGISGGTGYGGEAEDQAREIFDVNLNGVLNTVHPALDHMTARHQGQIAIISSLAAFNGWPGAPAYCASKAAVRLYGEALHGAMKPEGVIVTAVCPGFIESRLTAVNDYPMPFLMTAPRAARIIAAGLKKGGPRLVFPYCACAIIYALTALPAYLTARFLARLPKKPSSHTTLG